MKTRKGTGAGLEVIGRLKEIPVIRKTNNDKLVANIVLAVDEIQKNDAGQSEEYTEWLSVVVWGNAAQFIQDYARPGLRLRLTAKVKTEKEEVTDADGKKYVYSIPKFHTGDVEAMDSIEKNESNAEIEKQQ
ncbi:MAG: hypothetical protein COV52_09780 [Gammaproteobacteria bacterium CG11_big_fil_rev_8_21_14_0_20_46_22]|nr:MAG: hypothetical protein COV52_09780 [Gammaproteobacteria bacterium CG11_big_fil_rev_8_21_14_0_20_46_22]